MLEIVLDIGDRRVTKTDKVLISERSSFQRVGKKCQMFELNLKDKEPAM